MQQARQGTEKQGADSRALCDSDGNVAAKLLHMFTGGGGEQRERWGGKGGGKRGQSREMVAVLNVRGCQRQLCSRRSRRAVRGGRLVEAGFAGGFHRPQRCHILVVVPAATARMSLDLVNHFPATAVQSTISSQPFPSKTLNPDRLIPNCRP